MKRSREDFSCLKFQHSAWWDFGIIFLLTFLTIFSQAMAGKQELQAVIQGNGIFTKQLYSVLSKKTGNVFFSPISAHAVLSMVYQGAEGTTHQAFAKVLGMPDHIVAATGYQDVIGHLNNVSDVQLLMANRIYVMQGYELKPAFKDITEKRFLSEVQAVNFKDNVSSANTINQWVEEKTQKKIKDLISPDMLDDSTRLVLVNAIYFKGNWASKFDKSLTKTEKFYLNDNDTIDVQMMNAKGKYFYKEDESLDAKILELPYLNPDVSLLVILPNKRNGIAELEKKLAEIDLTNITANIMKTEVVVKLPKFKIETTIDLNDPLEEVGLGEIFTNKANFSGMLKNSEPLVVSQVIQKAFIEVNEEGTEAAAATAVGIKLMCMPLNPLPPGEFIADHPFVVILKSRGWILDEPRQARVSFDGLPLFQGRVSRPTV